MTQKRKALPEGLNEDQILALAKQADVLRAAAAQIMNQRRATVEAERATEREAGKKKSAEAMVAGTIRRRTAMRSRRAIGVDWYDALDDEGQMRAIAEANLKNYGTILPPAESQLAALEKECPQCHKTKPALSGFGPRISKGGMRVQSYCKQCRNEADKHERWPNVK